MLYYIILDYVLLYYILLYYIMLYYVILYHIILYYIMSYYIILYYIILYYIIWYDMWCYVTLSIIQNHYNLYNGMMLIQGLKHVIGLWGLPWMFLSSCVQELHGFPQNSYEFLQLVTGYIFGYPLVVYHPTWQRQAPSLSDLPRSFAAYPWCWYHSFCYITIV